MSKFTQSQILKQEKIIVKDSKNSNIVNFIIPNGLQIGLDQENFRKGIVLFSNTSDPTNVQNLLYIKDNILYYNGVRVSSGSSSTGSSGGAPVDAQYLVAASNSTLTNEKVLTAGTNITFVDGGTTLTISAQTGSAGSYAPNSAQYVVLASTSTLSNERVLTAGSNINITDNGANSTVIISAVTSSVIPTGSDTQIQYNSGGLFAGSSNLTFNYSTNTFQSSIINSTSGTFTFLTGSIIKSTSGITGSITKLIDGTDYIRAGSNVSIVTESNGAITISSTTGSSGAPASEQYLVLTSSAVLTNERVLTAGANITFVDGGAGGALTISATTGTTGAPATDQYLVLSASSTLTNERVLTAGTNITFTDGGAGGALTISATTSSASTYNIWSAEAPPTVANAKDDEFNSGTLSGWTFWDAGSTGLTTGTLNGFATLSSPTHAGEKLIGLFKTAPTSSSGNYEYSFYTKCSISTQDLTNDPFVSLIVGVDLATNPTTSKVYSLALVNTNDTFRSSVYIYNNYQSWLSTLAFRAHASTTIFLRIRVSYSSATSRTTLGFDFSHDGVGWYQLNENSYAEQYKHIGIAINNVGGSTSLTGYYSFFRVNTTSSFFTLPSGSMAKIQYA